MNAREEALITYCVKMALDTSNPEAALVDLLCAEFDEPSSSFRVYHRRGRGDSCEFQLMWGRENLKITCQPRYEFERPRMTGDFLGDTSGARDYMLNRVVTWAVRIDEYTYRRRAPVYTPPVAPLSKCACGAGITNIRDTACIACIELERERHAIEKAQQARTQKVKNAVDIVYRVCLVAGHLLWLGVDDTSKRYMMLDFTPSRHVPDETQETLVLEL